MGKCCKHDTVINKAPSTTCTVSVTMSLHGIDIRLIALSEVLPKHFSPVTNLYLQNFPIVNE